MIHQLCSIAVLALAAPLPSGAGAGTRTFSAEGNLEVAFHNAGVQGRVGNTIAVEFSRCTVTSLARDDQGNCTDPVTSCDVVVYSDLDRSNTLTDRDLVLFHDGAQGLSAPSITLTGGTVSTPYGADVRCQITAQLVGGAQISHDGNLTNFGTR